MPNTRTIRYTLDDGTVLAVVALGVLPEPRISPTYRVRVKHHILCTHGRRGSPGSNNYTAEELRAHRGDERYVVDESEVWTGRRQTNDMVGDMERVRLERVWETDLFREDGRPEYEPEYRPHTPRDR